ncbi:DUF188 domain-containing protein [Clostridium sp. BJN0001]|uniref:DUF188 domain-containing protein n=1 Tax=Clostridium sp. BJN0001 TaxID=2930219 RepID=UPI001FD368E3|nr:DUF188 domain-containing protein [Clostridium sp. BJN0001]
MKIIIDGDACPGISIIELLVEKYSIYALLYCDYSHLYSSSYIDIKMVDNGFQSVDMYVVNNTLKDDIVVTDDYGVAAMCLLKYAKVINSKGEMYTDDNIDDKLYSRHISLKRRKAGKKCSKIKKRTKEDDEKLYSVLEKLIISK